MLERDWYPQYLDGYHLCGAVKSNPLAISRGTHFLYRIIFCFEITEVSHYQFPVFFPAHHRDIAFYTFLRAHIKSCRNKRPKGKGNGTNRPCRKLEELVSGG